MNNQKPSFEITYEMIDAVSEISELMGKLSVTSDLSSNPVLRRSNRIRTIQGTLAIEQNSLSLEQVSAILNGKRVLAPPKEVAEVKNACEIYGSLETLDPYSADDLLFAHSIMTRGLVEESGIFRTRPVGVVDSHGNILHVGTRPQDLPKLVAELLDWTKTSKIHPLIRSCVFHYELEWIHPFADGNGRMGRLWHTLLLSRWNPIFAWIPVEPVIHDRQQEYYDALRASNEAGESAAFIEFLLSAVKASLMEVIRASKEMRIETKDKTALRRQKIKKYLETHGSIANADVRKLCGVSPATANRILAGLVTEGKLHRYLQKGHWAYKR